MQRIWKYAKPVKLEGIDVLTLSYEHLLIYLCYHRFNHFFKLILLIDIVEFLKNYKNNINWDFVVEEAKRFNLSLILYYVLSFISQKWNLRFLIWKN